MDYQAVIPEFRAYRISRTRVTSTATYWIDLCPSLSDQISLPLALKTATYARKKATQKVSQLTYPFGRINISFNYQGSHNSTKTVELTTHPSSLIQKISGRDSFIYLGICDFGSRWLFLKIWGKKRRLLASFSLIIIQWQARKSWSKQLPRSLWNQHVKRTLIAIFV